MYKEEIKILPYVEYLICMVIPRYLTLKHTFKKKETKLMWINNLNSILICQTFMMSNNRLEFVSPLI